MKKTLFISCLLAISTSILFAQKPKAKSTNPLEREGLKSEQNPAFSTGSIVDVRRKAGKDSSFMVTLNTPLYKSGIAYLCYHLGKNLNIEDSTEMSNEGVAIFKGSRLLPGGIYAIVLPGKRYSLDFFIDKDQYFKVEIKDTNNILENSFIYSSENKMFEQYQKFVMDKGTLMQQERMFYNASRTKKDSTEHETLYLKYNKELKTYRDSVMNYYPQSMMSAMLNAMREPDILIKNPKTRQDSIDNYNDYKAHYWDGVSFMDARIIRTPFFLPKLEKYYREIIIQAPDSIIQDLDYRILYARSCPEMYKFLLNWFTDEYINPKYMGQDAIFVHLFEKYHSKGLTSWLNEKQMETISRRAYMQMSNLIGVKASNLEMIDSTGKPTSLYDLNAEYTLLVFWDPNCGHCKEELPRIDSIYRATWKKNGLKIYAVLSENENRAAWTKYIAEHNLGDWTHVYETKEMEKSIADAQRPGFKQLYDVIQTPTLVLLDKEKRIIGKKLGWSQLNDLLQTKWNSKKE